MKKKLALIVTALTMAIAVAIPAGAALAKPSANPHTAGQTGFTAMIVAVSGQTITRPVPASGFDVGIYIGPGVTNVTVDHAVVVGAKDEGILVQDTKDITIENSIVAGNAVRPYVGNYVTTTNVTEAKGIVLAGTANCTVQDNTVEYNHLGGIRVTDDGPGHQSFEPAVGATTPSASTGNVIEGNTLINNTGGCGIVVSANNPGAGLDDNLIEGNTITGGVGGIIVASGNTTNPFAAPIYNTATEINDNVVENSVIEGIVIHALFSGWVSSTELTGNTLANNGNEEPFAPPPDPVSPNTAGIEILTLGIPDMSMGTINDTSVTSDNITNDYYGVWHHGDNDTTIFGLSGNATVPIYPAP